ncbi:hypothetical protein [Amycolatopsis sp. NPDC054798]
MKPRNRFVVTATAAAAVIGGSLMAAAPAQASAAGSELIVGYTSAGAPSDPAAHWYVTGRLGSFKIRADHSVNSAVLETVAKGHKAWCWNQTAGCGAGTNGSEYRCSSTTPKYRDWIPVATSSQHKGWVARHCVYAVH